jgi:leader peptidase (prepilin peptidase)/N-methyltransferase
MIWFEILAGVWLFAFGAVIGSFLNVVVWRTPRGESLVGPSRCPKCGTAIRWYNNVPVFGWLWLGGKCRDCKLPISPRYPVVEFICGAMFLAVALAELAAGDPHVAGTWHARAGGFANVILDPDWPRIAAYALHMLLLCALLAWALMQVDEQVIPVRQIIGLWLIGFIAVPFMPSAATLGAEEVPRERGLFARSAYGLMRAFAGFAAGGSVAVPITLVARWLSRRTSRASKPYWAIVAALASVGLYLGPAEVLIVTLVALATGGISLAVGLAYRPLRSVPLMMDIFVAALLQICWAKHIVAAIAGY